MTTTPPLPCDEPDADELITRLKVREPADLVVLVPYLLHFHPTESVVGVFFDRGRLALTVRVDLPPADPAASLAAELRRLADHTGSNQLVLLGYSERPESRCVLQALTGQFGDPALDLLDALWVSGGRWWSLTCERGCCPPEGRTYDALSHPVAAQAVLAGLGVGTDRAAVAAIAAGPSAEDLPRLSGLAARVRANLSGGLRSRQRRTDRLVQRYLRGVDPPGETEALTLALLVSDTGVRDRCFGVMSRPSAEQHLRLWAAVVARAPDDLAAAPLCLLGIAGWLSGNGTLLNSCVERLELIAPTLPMGEICRDIARLAVPPQVWPEIAAGFRLGAPG